MKKATNDAGKRSSQKAARFHKKQMSSLKRGKVKPLGLFERMALKRAGRRDGKQGLPVREEDTWRSPFLDQEAKKYQEFCYRMWGRLQLISEDSLADVRLLMRSIPQTEAALAEARSVLADEAKRIQLSCTVRRKGEEKLTEEQVYRRRQRELSSQLLSLQGTVHTLETTLSKDTAKLAALRSRLAELEQTTGMICRRVLEHTKLRADAYWDAALKHHPEKSSLPMAPLLEITQEAEQEYQRSSLPLLEAGSAAPEQHIEKEAA